MMKNKLLFRYGTGRRKNSFFFLVFACVLVLNLTPAAAQEGERVIGTQEYELGDQMLGVDIGLLIPLFFQDFSGDVAGTNLSVGGLAAMQWQTYILPFLRVGLQVGGTFNISPQGRSLLMLPILAKATYLFRLERFEFPIFLGLGLNIVRYRDWSQLDISLHPGAGAFWRYDVNWSFGLHASWWLEFQPTTQLQSANQARIGHFLQITPAVLYHF